MLTSSDQASSLFWEYEMTTNAIKKMAAAIAFAMSLGCDRDGTDLLPQPDSSLDRVIEIGEVEVISKSQIEGLAERSDPSEWCANEDGDLQRCYYGQLSAPESATRGGATLTFKGTGDYVCIMVDPETVYWNQSIAVSGATEAYAYPDEQFDDGDIVVVGLSSIIPGHRVLNSATSLDFIPILWVVNPNKYGECFQTGSDFRGLRLRTVVANVRWSTPPSRKGSSIRFARYL